MADPPLIVCPIDFSDTSRTALQYACSIADHFGARVIALSVDDPLLATVAASSGEPMGEATGRELRRFIDASLPPSAAGPNSRDLQVAVGKPAAEILRVARDNHADLIVMSSHGRSGTSKRFFGSTTEGVLRATTVPVLVTPTTTEPIGSLSEIASLIRRIIVPVDLSPASSHQIRIAAGIADALAVPLIVPYVLESMFVPPSVIWALPGLDADRRAEAEARLQEITGGVAGQASAETLILTGDPSEEIVTLARARDAGLIVMGLHSSGFGGPRMGSVTYRVLSTTSALVLAIPPDPGPSFAKTGERSLAASNDSRVGRDRS